MAQVAPCLRRHATARPAAEPRGRGVGPRRDDALARARSGRSARSSTRATSTARATRRSTAPRSRCTRRASRSTRSRSSTSSRSAASSRTWAAARRIHELAALVPATANAAHYARIVREMATLRGLDPRGRRDRAARLGAARRDDRPRRPRRADRLRSRPAAGHERLQPHRGAAEGELRADHAPVRGRRRRHRRRRPASASSTSSRRASSPGT